MFLVFNSAALTFGVYLSVFIVVLLIVLCLIAQIGLNPLDLFSCKWFRTCDCWSCCGLGNPSPQHHDVVASEDVEQAREPRSREELRELFQQWRNEEQGGGEGGEEEAGKEKLPMLVLESRTL